MEGDAGPCGSCPPDTVCDPATAACVACIGDAECPDGVCLVDATDSANNQCVECLESDDCTDGVCDTTSNECIGCLMDGDCTEPGASACDTESNTCVGCSTDAQCSRLTDTPVCNEGTETCVECTADDESACGTNVCDVAMGVCTETPEGSATVCEPCVSDRQCGDGQVCGPMTFTDPDSTVETEVGNFCLWRRDATVVDSPMGSCTNTPPYRGDEELVSVSGSTVTVCTLRRTTCAALADFDTPCSAVGADEECGAADLNDGLCRMVDAVVNACTVPCISNNDCSSGNCSGTSFCEFE